VSLERPWEDEFNALIDQLQAFYSGTLFDPDVPREERLANRPQMEFVWAYKSFEAIVGDHKIMIEISDSPLGEGGSVLTGDSLQFLLVSTSAVTGGSFGIREEGGWDRFLKAARLAWEHQTGDAEFDRRFFIMGDHKDKPDMMNRPELRTIVIEAAPFEMIHFTRSRVCISDMIVRNKTLNMDHAQRRIREIAALADIFGAGDKTK